MQNLTWSAQLTTTANREFRQNQTPLAKHFYRIRIWVVLGEFYSIYSIRFHWKQNKPKLSAPHFIYWLHSWDSGTTGTLGLRGLLGLLGLLGLRGLLGYGDYWGYISVQFVRICFRIGQVTSHTKCNGTNACYCASNG